MTSRDIADGARQAEAAAAEIEAMAAGHLHRTPEATRLALDRAFAGLALIDAVVRADDDARRAETSRISPHLPV